MAYQGVTPSASAATALEVWPTCKLPTYEEVTQDPPTPPPPYSEILEETGGESQHFPAASSVSLDLTLSQQEAASPDEVSTTDHLVYRHDCMEQESASALERRRHITGDSGIVLCDEKVICLSGREEEADLCGGRYVHIETGEIHRQGDN
ncbi:unnamed protein product [Staurois parvus]|uniref:Uncharacterized protein n=1 Tax=Staurois parvus TaxID=386267 RepID=A0ABN9BX60_9NEOB|nr:unnamed protein product [Staurois parvus]